MDNIVIYHAHCNDGAGAVYAAICHFGSTSTYKPISHLKEFSDLIQEIKQYKNLYMCDIMLPKVVVTELLDYGLNVYSLDHHISNIREYEGFSHPRFFNFNDNNRSGAGIAWDYFFSHRTRPTIINYLEAFDLWYWGLPHSHEIYAYTSELVWGDAYDIYDQLTELSKLNHYELYELGKPIHDYRQKLLQANLRNVSKIELTVDNKTFIIPCLNSCNLISELGSHMAINNPFAMIWYINDVGEVKVSLRSTDNGEDVSIIAQKLGVGGGGHAKAAGTKFTNLNHMLSAIKFI